MPAKAVCQPIHVLNGTPLRGQARSYRRCVNVSSLGLACAAKALQRRPQIRIADPIGRGLNGRARIGRQTDGMPRRALLDGGRLHLEQNPRQAGEFIEHLQLPLQTLLLVTQTGRPMTVGDNQQQTAFAPRRHMAMFARGGLQLAFQQALQMTQALSVAKDGFQRFGFAKQNGGCSGRKRAKCHDQTPEVTEPPW